MPVLWPTRIPGKTHVWVMSLDTMQPASHCPVHGVSLRAGYCDRCARDVARREREAGP